MDSLTINSAFAASFNEGAKRAQEQRKEIADTIESSKTYLKWTERLAWVYSTVAPDATREAINAVTGWGDAIESGRAQLQGLGTELVSFADDQKKLKEESFHFVTVEFEYLIHFP